ncbi:MAG: hypothetical protein WCT50_04655 [Patescibacteria group bacterium]|jgi:hypothetical protein
MEKILIIDVDCPIDPEVFRDFGLKVIFSESLTRSLLSWNLWGQIDPWRTLLIFPGNGSNLVKKEINILFPSWLALWPYKSHISAKRFWEPGQNPVANVGNIGDGVYIGLKQVIVVDDVVSSGETCLKVYQRNNMYTPGTKWLSMCWVAQKSARLKNFSSLMAVEFVGEENKRAPINSLSTLIINPGICRSYSERNFPNRAEEFQALVKALND